MRCREQVWVLIEASSGLSKLSLAWCSSSILVEDHRISFEYLVGLKTRLAVLTALTMKFGGDSTLEKTIRGVTFKVQYLSQTNYRHNPSSVLGKGLS